MDKNDKKRHYSYFCKHCNYSVTGTRDEIFLIRQTHRMGEKGSKQCPFAGVTGLTKDAKQVTYLMRPELADRLLFEKQKSKIK